MISSAKYVKIITLSVVCQTVLVEGVCKVFVTKDRKRVRKDFATLE